MPEGFQEPVPDGYIPVFQDTNNAWFLLRTIVQDFEPETLDKANAFIKQFKVYPFNKPELRDSEQYVDGYGQNINAIAPYDDTFFDAIDDIVQEEKVKERDLAMMGMLKEIGIEKGKPFTPSESERAVLKQVAADTQQEMIDSVINAQDLFWEDRRWSYLVNPKVVRETGFTFQYLRMYDFTTRATTYYSAFSSVVTYGSETNYFVGGQDSQGNVLKGENTYKLTVPADVPVYHFWSALVYDNDSAAFVADTPKAGVSGLDQGLVKNDDGSVDIYFAPEPPNGLEANWAPTKPGVDYFLLFRFYGVEKELYEGNWKLNDLIKQ